MQKMKQKVSFPKSFLKTFLYAYSSFREREVGFTTAFTDYYMLCRMFAHFKKDKDKIKRSPKGCPITGKNNFITPKYIIVYAGQAHTRGVGEFLEYMFPDSLEYSTNQVKLDKKIKLNDLVTDKNTKLPDTYEDLIDDLLKM